MRELSPVRLWEPWCRFACSLGGPGNRHGENHDEISTDRSGNGLVVGRNHDSDGPKWSAHWRIPTSPMEPPIFMATTATPIILATTATTLSTPPCLATGTITKLARRGAVMTRSQLAKRCTLYLARRSFPSSLAQQLPQLGDIGRDPPRLIFGEQLVRGSPAGQIYARGGL